MASPTSGNVSTFPFMDFLIEFLHKIKTGQLGLCQLRTIASWQNKVNGF